MVKAKSNFKPVTFLQETKNQLKKISWLSRKEATTMTLTVIGVSLLMAIFVGGLDFVFTQLIGWIIK